MTSSPASLTSVPRLHQVGRFRLVAEIARGGMGVVYLARANDDDGREELFAVKTLLPEYAGEEQYRRMFLDEANLGVRLEHPNIVRTVEVGGSKKQHYMALEYLEGQSLRAVRKAVRDLSLEDGLRIVSDVLRALAYAHSLCDLDGTPLNVVHRDMSPENVFLTYDRRVILLDFGVAKADDGGSKTEVGKLKGRIRYMAPEQVLGAQVDGRADVFAVGILLWELITNTRFWEGVEEVAILRHLLEGEIPTLPEGACSPRLAAVCARPRGQTGSALRDRGGVPPRAGRGRARARATLDAAAPVPPDGPGLRRVPSACERAPRARAVERRGRRRAAAFGRDAADRDEQGLGLGRTLAEPRLQPGGGGRHR